MKKITFIPVGGLANRMRSVAAAVSLSRATNSELRIIWFRDWACPCPFNQLFEPFGYTSISLKEATVADLLLNDRPRRKNLWLPRLFEQLRYNKCIYEKECRELSLANVNFEPILEEGQTYMASFTCFYDCKRTIYKELFRPIKEIRLQIDTYTSHFNDHTIGVHIRRTDHVKSILNSPTELFVEKMRKEVEREESTRFYLATDSEEDKRILGREFGERIICRAKQADRSSITGIQDAVADLYTLSKTKKIVGSSGSSFSEMASWLENAPCEILTK